MFYRASACFCYTKPNEELAAKYIKLNNKVFIFYLGHICVTAESYASLWYIGSHFVYCFYLFGVLGRFQHCTGHITTGSWKGRGNQYIQFVRVLYCKLLTNGKQLPAFPLQAGTGIKPRPQRWEARVLPLCHRGPLCLLLKW